MVDIPPDRREQLRQLLRFVPDIVKLFWAATRDPRVPWYAKATTAAAVAYVASPLDVIPDVIPVIGQLDDAWIMVRALRFLLREAGQDVLQDLWQGTDEGFDLLLVVAGIRD